MAEILHYRIPIRLRLTLWYVLLLAITFTTFAVYLVARFEHSLKSAIDSSLQITVSKTVSSFDEEDYFETHKLTFENTRQTQTVSPDFAMRLLSFDGEVWDTYGLAQNIPQWDPVDAGYTTQSGMDKEYEWRIFSQPVVDSSGKVLGWVQAARSIESVTDAVQDLRDQLLLGIPLILLFAGLGGYFLATRALRPIERITDTAQEITARNLSRKINYQGSMDEVGRLAQTFDRMLERLQSAFERERRFSGDAAHELRTPLTVLKGQIEVTLNRRRDPAEYEDKLKELSVQVDRLIRLSNALLFLSRSEQNQPAFLPASVNLQELFDVLIEQFQPFFDEKGLKINANIPANLHAFGDADHLIRLFMNLLENALKYAPEGGQVGITVLKKSGLVEVRIHNSGPGIPQEHLPHLFERFYRVDSDRSRRSGGSGLGLAIAHEIVNMHGGEIEAQSEPGQGVTVVVRLSSSDS